MLWTASSGAGPPLVLCHGGPGGYDYLEPVANLVDDLVTVHRFDQRGGGRSTKERPWTIAALVSDMETLRSRFGHERWLVGGHSWGAHLALFYALAHPERVRGLILMNGTGVRWGWGVQRRANRLPRLTAAERAEVERLERDGSQQARERLRDVMWLTDFADRKNALRSPRLADYPVDPAVVAALELDWKRALDGIDLRLPDLHVPALVLHGAADPIGEEGPRELARLLPDARFVLLPGVGHVPWLERPATVRHQLRGFLSSLGTNGSDNG